MSPTDKLNVLVVIGSLSEKSSLRSLLPQVGQLLENTDCHVEVVDFQSSPLPLFDVEKSYTGEVFLQLKQKVEKADVLLLGTPDYHGSMSSALKNFLDHFWHEFAGKLFATIVVSYEKGLTTTDHIRTVTRQCYGWNLPYGISYIEKEDFKDGAICSDVLRKRIEMLVRDIRVYGPILAHQRRLDLKSEDPGFLARYREKK